MAACPRVYLAGPDVFRPDAAQYFALLAAVCDRLGLEALSPFDETFDSTTTALDIYAKNMAMLRSAQGVVANLAPFRGAEPDSGTVFEVGVAAALGLPVVAYGTVAVGPNLATAALFAANAEEALQVLAGLLKS